MLSAYHIYTDGACSGNPGPGGWGAVILQDKTIITTLSDTYVQTTNNKMELMAVIQSLERLMRIHGGQIDYSLIEHHNFSFGIHEVVPTNSSTTIVGVSIDLYTDSKYVQQGVLERMGDWKLNAWRTSRNKPIAHSELWRKLDILIDMIGRENIQWHRVKGHDGNVYNEMADQLATGMIQ